MKEDADPCLLCSLLSKGHLELKHKIHTAQLLRTLLFVITIMVVEYVSGHWDFSLLLVFEAFENSEQWEGCAAERPFWHV